MNLKKTKRILWNKLKLILKGQTQDKEKLKLVKYSNYFCKGLTVYFTASIFILNICSVTGVLKSKLPYIHLVDRMVYCIRVVKLQNKYGAVGGLLYEL